MTQGAIDEAAATMGPSTTAGRAGSRFLPAAVLTILASCGTGRAEEPPGRGSAAPVAPAPPRAPAPAIAPTAPAIARVPTAPETCLGVADQGIWSDLDEQVQIALPADVTPERVTATVDVAHRLLVVSVDGWAVKPYPLGGDAELVVGARRLALRPGDRTELAPLLREDAIVDHGGHSARVDRDRDGLADPLDVLIGAKKTVLNGDAYVGGYERLAYPMGDVPRERGVCTDVIVRSLRNAGLDLQAALHQDIGRARAAYPMVKGRGDPNIDHRRVKTLLPFLRRHLDERAKALDDPRDPLRPGDLVLMDTFPSRSGPDHIGIVSDRSGDSGLPLVINNWTDGSVTSEMDLLGWVPVTHRFRVAPKR